MRATDGVQFLTSEGEIVTLAHPMSEEIPQTEDSSRPKLAEKDEFHYWQYCVNCGTLKAADVNSSARNAASITPVVSLDPHSRH